LKFKLASLIHALYALIGLSIVIFYEFEHIKSIVFSCLLYVLIPLYGAYGCYVANAKALVVSILFFISQSVRHVGNENVLPHIAPISISFPFGDFASGNGYLIDFFALFMAFYVGYLLVNMLSANRLHKQDSA